MVAAFISTVHSLTVEHAREQYNNCPRSLIIFLLHSFTTMDNAHGIQNRLNREKNRNIFEM